MDNAVHNEEFFGIASAVVSIATDDNNYVVRHGSSFSGKQTVSQKLFLILQPRLAATSCAVNIQTCRKYNIMQDASTAERTDQVPPRVRQWQEQRQTLQSAEQTTANCRKLLAVKSDAGRSDFIRMHAQKE